MLNITIPQNRFNRSQREIQRPVLPERLLRLNREIGTEQTKAFDYLYLVRGGLRIRVCVLRDEDNKFFATAQIGGRAFRIQGGSPSGAIWMLSIVIGTHLAYLPSATRHALLLGQEVSNA